MSIIKLTKFQKDDITKAKSFDEGNMYVVGELTETVEVGKKLTISPSTVPYGEGIQLPTVTEVVDSTTFKTKNSIYKIEVLS